MYPQISTQHTDIPYFPFSSDTEVKRSPKSLPIYSDFINNLDSNRYFFKEGENIYVNIIEEEDGFRVEFDDLNIWSTGRTKELALNNLKKEIILLYEELEALGKKKLGNKPLGWWIRLNQLIEKTDEEA